MFPPPVLVTAGWATGPVVLPGAGAQGAEKLARRALSAELDRLPLPPHKVSVIEGVPREAIPAAAKALKAGKDEATAQAEIAKLAEKDPSAVLPAIASFLESFRTLRAKVPAAMLVEFDLGVYEALEAKQA